MERRPVSQRVLGWVQWVLVVVLLLATGACRPSPSPFPTPTARRDLDTPTPTATWTHVPTPTLLPALVTATFTPTGEATATPTVAEPTATTTPTSTPTQTLEPTATLTATPTATDTPSPVPTATATQAIVPTATPTPVTITVATGWRGEYFPNPNLEGSPALVRQDPAIGFDWVFDAPAPGLPVDNFSVRWTSVVAFEEGLYDLHATMDDGMRVYVDDELLIDEWHDQARRTVTASRHMSAGTHALRVEYYDRQHHAIANLWWEKHRSVSNWKGVYWANQNLMGNPALIRDDANIDFDWGLGSPGGGIPNDHFSARWTRTMQLEEGLYRFIVHVDDGVRLWVNDQLIIDDWTDRPLRELTADYTIGGTGAHEIRVEYYENTVHARIHVSWFKAGAPSFPDWKGEYFDNVHLAGDPVLVRNDRRIGFDWDERAPAPGLPADNFSVRWTRERQIEPGWYRYTFRVDDGVRFYVDDNLVLNEWHQTWGDIYVVEVELPWKPRLVIEYYEGSGDARIHVTQERIR